MPFLTAALLCIAPVVTDGDSIRCHGPGGYVGKVRLLGIDAPDTTNSSPCRGHFGDHVCDDKGSALAKRTLAQAVGRGPLKLLPVTRDRYGRLVAQVEAGGRDLSCWQLRQGTVRYIAKYDNGRRIARACPELAR